MITSHTQFILNVPGNWSDNLCYLIGSIQRKIYIFHIFMTEGGYTTWSQLTVEVREAPPLAQSLGCGQHST